MPRVDRFSVSLDTELLAAFDRYITQRGYENRSEAVRDLIRELLVTSRTEGDDAAVAAVLTVAVDHREGEALDRVRRCLVDCDDVVVGSMHVPIDAHRDQVVIALKGPSQRTRQLADKIQALRGVTHGHYHAVPKCE